MSFDDFNMVTAKKPYAYRRNPLYGHAYVILRRSAAGGYEPAGGYTVLDGGEDETLSERKVMNLVALMNDEEGRLIDLRGSTRSRLLFSRLPAAVPGHSRVMFYTRDCAGVTRENAVLELDEDMGEGGHA